MISLEISIAKFVVLDWGVKKTDSAIGTMNLSTVGGIYWCVYILSK
jgi:hypothetical protein